MESSSRALGIGPTNRFDGRDCVVKGRTQEFHAMVEAEILQHRGNPYEGLIHAATTIKKDDGKTDEVAIRVLVDAFSRSFRTYRYATQDDILEYRNTPRGRAFMVWYCLRDNFEKTWTIDRVQFILQESMQQSLIQGRLAEWSEWYQSLLRAIEIASGEDFLGNSIGLRPQVVATGAGQSEDATDTSARNSDTDQKTSES